ncbi:cytochrome P450 [Duganella sp. FT92W]|uniref:Cytochrome P450 n=1 Tax=Pseudoduganella rivuli TaxID=2666085 RepID=A0A7X2IMZ0_9BURK|nr:cytochrome P450 [Pseudoduganella rivuli]MRV72829.1 cytochrome P450 [Pseudoduganella rivuli]
MDSTPTALPLPTFPPPLRTIESLPGPRRWPLVGNVLQIRPLRLHQDVEAWCREYGDFFQMYMGPEQALVVADHDVVAQVLKQRPDTFRRPALSERIMREMGCVPGLFDAEGQDWRNQRRMVMHAFSPQGIKAYFPSLVKVALRLQQRWDRAAQDERTIVLSDDLKRYTVDIIAGLAFGTDVDTINGGEEVIQRHLDVILPAIARRTLSFVAYWRVFKLPQDRRLEHSVATVRHAIQDLIGQARTRMAREPERAAHPANLLEAMLAAAGQPGSGVGDEAVVGNVLTMLLAGEDTTANSIAWLLYQLQRHPEALARARDEVLRHAPDPAAFTMEQMDKLEYLNGCIQESMRIKPVAPFIPVEAMHDTSVAGIHVPARTLVWCVLRHHSMADSHVEQAAQFDPQRWLHEGPGAIDRKVAMPFGAGPRICPGRYLALLEMKVVMAMLLGRYDIDAVATPDGKEAEELMAFVMSPIGLAMRLRRQRWQ